MTETLPDSYKKLYQYILDRLTLDEPLEELSSITYLALSHLFGLSKAEIITDRSINISNREVKMVTQFIKRINANEPIQYVFGEAEFYGRKFEVNPSVLIPRPETEELVDLIIRENRLKKVRLLDIGTGSGCIPITLCKELSDVKAYAIDIDPRTIKTARNNTARHSIEIEFMLMDILSEQLPKIQFDVIVSNPPYVRESEREHLKANVIEYEPAKALFVRDDDPLLFYRRIGELAQSALKDGGKLYFEVHENFGDDVKVMLEVLDYEQVELIKDLNGKDRIVRAVWSTDLFTQPNES